MTLKVALCQIIFKGPYKEETVASKASLVLNWLGHHGSTTLKSPDVDKGLTRKFQSP